MQTEGALAHDDWNNGRREKLIGMTPSARIPLPKELAAQHSFSRLTRRAHMTGSCMLCDNSYSTIGAEI